MKQNKEKISIFIRKLRKYARIYKIFVRNDKIYVKDKLCMYLVKDIIKDLPVTYVNSPKTATKIVIPFTLDDEVNLFLHSMFTKTEQKKDPRIVKLFRPLTDDELVILSKSLKLPFKPNKKDPKLKEMVDILHKSHPEIKPALLKSAEDMKNLMKK
tara:strand:+ start:1126 stop:1593 length:468 start_codon:yes stop_codon:yes gene_type:complete